MQRRNFLKTSSAISLSTAFISDLYAIALTSIMNSPDVGDSLFDYSCEIIRSSDLMYLKYYFYNARVTDDKTSLLKIRTNDELFVYVKLPSQHIAEELETDIDSIESRRDWEENGQPKRKKSFLSGSSWLAFRLIGDKVELNNDFLLDWNSNFRLVTIDDFASMNRAGRRNENYGITISRIKNELKQKIDNWKEVDKNLKSLIEQLKTSCDEKIERRSELAAKYWEEVEKKKSFDGKTFMTNAHTSNVQKWPLTKFDLPYKMHLSPIGSPDKKLNESYYRVLGEHLFISNNKIASEEYNVNNVRIYKPWENQLIFKNQFEEVFDPRFKVVSWTNQHEDDNDNCTELLPAPVHREELHQLTMQSEFNRDVLAEKFKISILGGSTYLKYKNDNPQKYSTVAWEQAIKYARDNYVAITFRAVEIQTGLKLLVSIVSDRNYKFGVSFLQKRYFVTYAENEKVYIDEKVISRIPFKKIIPKSQGSYFIPYQPQKEGLYSVKESFVVMKEKPESPEFDQNDIIPFDYIGIDKNGKEHNFSLKMAFVPAESYIVTEGEYCYKGTCYSSDVNKTIPFTDIGLLNPFRDERYIGNPPPNEAEDCTGGAYRYRLEKNFDIDDRRINITDDLIQLNRHFKVEYSCYRMILNKELTYARIKLLQDKKVIDRNATSASFNTKDLLLFADIGEKVQNSTHQNDSFSQEFVLKPKMQEANLIISQIDQLEGVSNYRMVRYAEDYFKHNQELDDEKTSNNVRLLFELIKWNGLEYMRNPISNFFKENYKQTGALVNPGICISHVSVLDQGITYNDVHNITPDELESDNNKKGLVEITDNKVSSVSSISIFGEVDAEILGISLLDIVQEVFQVDDLPMFNYLQEAHNTLERLKRISGEFREVYYQWKSEYDDLAYNVKKLSASLANLDKELKRIAKDEARNWIELMIEQYGARQFFLNQKKFVNARLSSYYKSILEPVKTQIYNTYPSFGGVDFEDRLQNLLNVKSLKEVGDGDPPILVANSKELNEITDALSNLLDQENLSLIPPNYYKEVAKIYCVSILINSKTTEFSQKVTAIAKISQQDETLAKYQQSLLDGLNEANLFAEAYLGNQIQELKSKYCESLDNMQRDIDIKIDNLIITGLNKIPFFNPKCIKLTIAPLLYLIRIYEDYQKIYTNLKGEYYKKLRDELGLPNEIPELNLIEEALISALKKELEKEVLSVTSELQNDPQFIRIKNEYNTLRKGLGSRLNESEKWLSDYVQMLSTEIKNANGQVITIRDQIEKTLQPYLEFIELIDDEYEAQLKKISDIKKVLKEKEQKLKNFFKDRINSIEDLINQEVRKLSDYNKPNSKKYKEIQGKIRTLRSLHRKINEASHQKLNYRHNTKNFRRASLGGIIDFVPNKTELDIDVNYELQLAIDDFDRPPTVVKQEFQTSSTLKDFKLSFLKLISIDFDRVTFITGSNVKDDFTVNIRDVQFAGSLSFVQKFQEFLKTMDPNLVFDITSSYAKVGYGISIPNFPGGYFNFFNFNLSAQLILPFNPDKSLQLLFGFGSEENKFGITVSAIFGGQGYFNLIAEPKRGIVGMILVMEFGAVFSLNLGPAQGTAYLVGGVFIKRYSGNYEIRAYILCVGRFNVLGLFSAGMTFYLGLSGNGDTLYGECVVTVTKKFSSFFKISVSCRMRKKIKGAKSENSSDYRSFKTYSKASRESSLTLYPVYGNLYEGESIFYSEQSINLIFKDRTINQNMQSISARSNRFEPIATLSQSGVIIKRIPLTFSSNKGSEGTLYILNVDLENLNIRGDIDLVVMTNGGHIFFEDHFRLLDTEYDEIENEKDISDQRATKLYYQSYYPK